MEQEYGYRILHGYYDKGKFRLLTWASFVGQFVHPAGGEGSKGGKGGGLGVSLFQPALSFTVLEYMIIWCKNQVIINQLTRNYVLKARKNIKILYSNVY